MKVSPVNLEKHVRFLTDVIGVRLAGSAGERRAAEYIRQAFEGSRARVSVEEYPVMERAVTFEKLEVLYAGGSREEIPCSLYSSAPSTGGKTVEAEPVLFDYWTGYQREDLSFLRGKAVIHLHSHIEKEEYYRRLMEAQPAFVLFIDTRYTGTQHLADGLFPSHVRKYGAVPCLNVAYMDAWRLLQRKARKLRLCVEGGMRESKTTAVVCEIPGTEPDGGILYAAGHHDTQADTVGADDNAIGCAAVIELARVLSARPHRRSFRLVSFGAEEQLSAGSAAYVRRHRAELEKNGVFMCNFDSMGSALGWNVFTVSADEKLRGFMKKTFNAHGVWYRETTEPCPYTDQFPFAACGVPGVYIGRSNCEAGHFFHHRADNVPEYIGFDTAAELIGTAAEFLSLLADADDVSAFRTIPPEDRRRIDALFKEVFGGF